MNTREQPVSLVDLLDRLVEVPEPAPVSMFPQTWGWLVVVALLLGFLGWAMLALVRRYQKNAYRRAALNELEKAGDNTTAVAEILRRSALTAYSRQRVASLAGNEWLVFLESTGEGLVFTSGPGARLITVPYQGGGDTPGIGVLAANWVRRHRPEAGS